MGTLDSGSIDDPTQDGGEGSPSTPVPSTGLRVVLAFALSIGVVGAAAPALLFTWLLLALLAAGVIAEALEQSGGLAPTTFGGGYYLSAMVDAGVVLWSLILLARRRPSGSGWGNRARPCASGRSGVGAERKTPSGPRSVGPGAHSSDRGVRGLWQKATATEKNWSQMGAIRLEGVNELRDGLAARAKGTQP